MGKTGSGKDCIVTELVKHGYEKIVTYTTRPIRNNEVDGVTYNYISNEDFENKIKKGFFIEYKDFNVYDGSKWHYGTSKLSIKNIKDLDKKVIILSPKGYRDLLRELPIKHKSFYIHSNDNVIKKRLLMRGDNENEIRRRLQQDNLDFSGIAYLVDRCVYNNQNSQIKDIVRKIIFYTEVQS